MSDIPLIPLNSGTSIPQLGLGIWQTPDEDAERLVRYAIHEAGYRHIDTAAAYGNETGVGRGMRTSSVPREEIFLTTKLWNADQGYDRALRAFDASLERLGTDYVDLYLIHWPLLDDQRIVRTWEALERIHAEGRARAIGVSNFEPRHLRLLLDRGGVVPAVNQIELHPHFPQRALRAFCAEAGIAITSWSPLGGTSNSWGPDRPNTLLGDPVIGAIAQEHGVSPAQVIVRWHLQNGLVVIPKSLHEERIAANIDVFGFALTPEQLAAIDGLETGVRVGGDPNAVNVGAPAD